MPEKLEYHIALEEHKKSRDALHDMFMNANPSELTEERFADAVREHKAVSDGTIMALKRIANKIQGEKAPKLKDELKRMIENFRDPAERQMDMCNRFIDGQLLNPIRDKIEKNESIAKHKRALLKGNPSEYFSVRFKSSEAPLAKAEEEIHAFVDKIRAKPKKK